SHSANASTSCSKTSWAGSADCSRRRRSWCPCRSAAARAPAADPPRGRAPPSWTLARPPTRIAVVTDPSLIPPRGRALDPDEREALERDLETIVGGSHLFKSLDDEGRRELIRTGYVLGFAEDEVLMEQGEPGDAMYLV